MRLHRSKGREHIRTPITKGQKRDTSHAFAHPQYARDGAEIDAEKVASRNADCTEKKSKPYDEYDEGDRFSVG